MEIIRNLFGSKRKKDKDIVIDDSTLVDTSMTDLYKILSRKNKKELTEAIAQKNRIKKAHIFDILAERGTISYLDIFDAIKELYVGELSSLNIIFLENANNILSEKGKNYVTKDGTKREVTLSFFPKISQIKKTRLPVVILPRNEYFSALSTEARNTSFRGEGGKSFTFEEMVEEAIRANASDIHFTYSETYTYASFREDGDLIARPEYLLSLKEGMFFLRKIKQEATTYTKGDFHADEHELPQGARIEYNRLSTDIRLQFTPKGTRKGINCLTARLLVHQALTAKGFSFETMGYDKDFCDLIEDAKHLRSGLMLVTGVTGSGKSTLLSYFTITLPTNKRIMTFEDPIEYRMDGSHISQHQENVPSDPNMSFTFSDGIRSSKRSDPDVIYIGEIRKNKLNTDLIDSVIESAKAGQLVLSTVHIDSAFDIYRSMNIVFGVDEDTIGDTLLLTISQVLLKRLCPNCRIKDNGNTNKKILESWKEKGKVKYVYQDKLNYFIENYEKYPTYLRNEEGCPQCKGGAIGRIPIYEYLKPDIAFMQWLSEKNYNRFAVEEKACSQENKHLAKNKLTTYVEALIRGDVDAGEDTLNKIL